MVYNNAGSIPALPTNLKSISYEKIRMENYQRIKMVR